MPRRADRVPVKGINYDVGTEFSPGELSRSVWNQADAARDFEVIRDELHCNSVNVYGTELARLEEAAGIAIDLGLHVSFQARSVDQDQRTTTGFVEEAAATAETLRRRGAITLNVGCEITMFTSGFIPGKSFMRRMRNMVWVWPFFSHVNRRLNVYLSELAATARSSFKGEVTYGSGSWERVDWELFDLVGVNLYRDRWNEKTYRDDLRGLLDGDRAVIITELGCATFAGAERRGGGGWTIVDFDADPPMVRPGHRRSERAQAELVGELLDILREEGVDGVYVFDFLAAGFPHDSDPARDLDMASYGIVKVLPGGSAESIVWEKKESFATVANRFEVW